MNLAGQAGDALAGAQVPDNAQAIRLIVEIHRFLGLPLPVNAAFKRACAFVYIRRWRRARGSRW
jgi:hypothetical protein